MMLFITVIRLKSVFLLFFLNNLLSLFFHKHSHELYQNLLKKCYLLSSNELTVLYHFLHQIIQKLMNLLQNILLVYSNVDIFSIKNFNIKSRVRINTLESKFRVNNFCTSDLLNFILKYLFYIKTKYVCKIIKIEYNKMKEYC